MVIRDPVKASELEGYGVGYSALALTLIHVASKDYKLCVELGNISPSGGVPASKRVRRGDRWCLVGPVAYCPPPGDGVESFGSGLETVEDVEALRAFFAPGGLLDALIDGLASEGIKVSANRIRRGVGYAP